MADPRNEAIRAVSRWDTAGKYINLELSAALDRSGLEGSDRALAAALIYGVAERKLTLDYVISRLSDRAPEELDSGTFAALRVGLYQLIYTDRIPDHAAVNETVAAAPEKSRGFVNACLRRFLREGGKVSLPPIEDGKYRHLSIKYSIPEWILSSWDSDYGCAEDIAAAFTSEVPAVTLRVNTLRTAPRELTEKLTGSGLECRLSPVVDDMIEIGRGIKIEDIYGFEDGLWFVEDASSRLCAEAVGARPGDTVIDVCAAPGGKSFSMAIDMKNEGKVYSFDLHKNKTRLILAGADRLGLNIIKAAANDARHPIPELLGTADKVLCDVPCSGLGVIAKKPDIRYKAPSDCDRLPDVQYEILSSSLPYLKKNGVLVYSTCTLRRAENEDVVRRFINSNPTLKLTAERTFFPHTDGTDGFYYAVMQKYD